MMPRRLTETTCVIFSRGLSGQMGSPQIVPALLWMISGQPSLRSVSAKNREICSTFETSTTSASTSAPSLATNFFVSSRPDCCMSARAIALTPRRASSTAVTWPIPEPAPVISATLFWISIVLSCNQSFSRANVINYVPAI